MGDVDRRVEAAAKAEERALAVVRASLDAGKSNLFQVVRALSEAGLLAAPSALDRLAAWADEHRVDIVIERALANPLAWIATAWLADGSEFEELDADVQVAAERVLARLEGTSDG